MTPFGEKLRQLRAEKGVNLKEMAAALNVSSAYLSALEHGHRGRPSWMLIQKIIGYFNIIWDEADELHGLADLSDPKVTIDTAGLPPEATRLANRFAHAMPRLTADDMAAIAAVLEVALRRDERESSGNSAT